MKHKKEYPEKYEKLYKDIVKAIGKGWLNIKLEQEDTTLTKQISYVSVKKNGISIVIKE